MPSTAGCFASTSATPCLSFPFTYIVIAKFSEIIHESLVSVILNIVCVYAGCKKLEMKQWCILLPTSHIKRAHAAAVDPLSAAGDIFMARQLPDSMVVCTPQLTLYSSGRMRTDIVADIPVKTVEHSIASMKYLLF